MVSSHRAFRATNNSGIIGRRQRRKTRRGGEAPQPGRRRARRRVRGALCRQLLEHLPRETDGDIKDVDVAPGNM